MLFQAVTLTLRNRTPLGVFQNDILIHPFYPSASQCASDCVSVNVDTLVRHEWKDG